MHSEGYATLRWGHAPVSLPSAAAHWPAATAAAEPPEEPPGTHRGSHGFRVTCAAGRSRHAASRCVAP